MSIEADDDARGLFDQELASPRELHLIRRVRALIADDDDDDTAEENRGDEDKSDGSGDKVGGSKGGSKGGGTWAKVLKKAGGLDGAELGYAAKLAAVGLASPESLANIRGNRRRGNALAAAVDDDDHIDRILEQCGDDGGAIGPGALFRGVPGSMRPAEVERLAGRFPELLGDIAVLRFLRGNDLDPIVAAQMLGRKLSWFRDNGLDVVRDGLLLPPQGSGEGGQESSEEGSKEGGEDGEEGRGGRGGLGLKPLLSLPHAADIMAIYPERWRYRTDIKGNPIMYTRRAHFAHQKELIQTVPPGNYRKFNYSRVILEAMELDRLSWRSGKMVKQNIVVDMYGITISLLRGTSTKESREYVLDPSCVTQLHISPGIYPLYTFIAVYAPMCTRYACIYIIYTPYIHLIHLYTPYIHPIYAINTPLCIIGTLATLKGRCIISPKTSLKSTSSAPRCGCLSSGEPSAPLSPPAHARKSSSVQA